MKCKNTFQRTQMTTDLLELLENTTTQKKFDKKNLTKKIVLQKLAN